MVQGSLLEETSSAHEAVCEYLHGDGEALEPEDDCDEGEHQPLAGHEGDDREPATKGQRAGVVSRFLADAIDLLVIVATLVGVYFAVSGARFLLHPRQFSWPEPSALYLGTLGWILLIVYLTIGWASTGRTWGKSVLGLRVVSSRDVGLPLWRAFVRAVLCALFPIGLFWSAVSTRNESVQDLLVRTTVVYDWGLKLPRLE
jgi:uncharacterized RDD family membrane protein YckC